jgi:hypothetical protein
MPTSTPAIENLITNLKRHSTCLKAELVNTNPYHASQCNSTDIFSLNCSFTAEHEQINIVLILTNGFVNGMDFSMDWGQILQDDLIGCACESCQKYDPNSVGNQFQNKGSLVYYIDPATSTAARLRNAAPVFVEITPVIQKLIDGYKTVPNITSVTVEEVADETLKERLTGESAIFMCYRDNFDYPWALVVPSSVYNDEKCHADAVKNLKAKLAE